MAKKVAPKKKSNAMNAEELLKLDVLVKSLEKDYGKGIIQSHGFGQELQRFERQIPSGSVGLDLAIGPMMRRKDGSWQVGYAPSRIIEIFGPEGGGKTTMCLQLIANAQAMGLRCAFNDMEHTLDPNYARSLGVNMQDLIISQPSSGEDCLEIMERQVRSGLFDVIVEDSIAALIPQSEIDGEMGDAQMGAQARLMSQAMRKLNPLLTAKGCHTNLVFTNQIRNKIGVMFGNPETTTGGNAMKFYASFRIEIRKGEPLKEGEVQYGHKIRAKVIKNKIAPPFRTAEFELIYGKGIDYVMELLDLAAGRSLITVDGSWYKVDGKPIAQGRAAAADVLRRDRALAYRLYDGLLTKVLLERGYNLDGSTIPGMHEDRVHSSQTDQFRPMTQAELEAAVDAADAGTLVVEAGSEEHPEEVEVEVTHK